MNTFTIPEPIAGDPELLSGFAAKYQKIAEALKSAAGELAKLANADMIVSLAINEVRAKANSAQADTLKVAQHYGGAASTYASYAAKLRDIQTRANHARATIAGFKGSADHAKKLRDAVVDQTKFLLPNQQTADDLQAANAQLAQYQNDYSRAMTMYSQAVADKAEAVHEAITKLEDATKVAGLTDSGWQAARAKARDLYEWSKTNLAPLLEKLRAVLKVIKDVVDIIAVIAAALKVNPKILGVIIAVDVGLSEYILNITVVLFFLGDASASDVISAVLDLAVVALVVIPGGKAAGKVIKSKLLTTIGEKVLKDGPSVAKDVLGTDANALGLGDVRFSDPFIDVTSPPWTAPVKPLSSETPQDPKQFAGSLVFDGVKAVPIVGGLIGGFADLVKDVKEMQRTFSGTGS